MQREIDGLGKLINHFDSPERKLAADTEPCLLIEYGAEKYHLDMWKARYNLALHNFKNQLTYEKQITQQLKSYRLTDKQLDIILVKGIYIKELPTTK